MTLFRADAVTGPGCGRHGENPRSSVHPQLLRPFLAAALATAFGLIPAHAAPLQVTVAGVRNAQGKINICVFDTDLDFPDCSANPVIISRRLPATLGHMRFDFDVPPGLHAVSVLHDENDNGRIDTNIFGVPREGGGVSNDPTPRWGPPRFADAVFRLPPEGGQIVISMVYP
jgi:uncharacterized protein (DUF2141 family)